MSDTSFLSDSPILTSPALSTSPEPSAQQLPLPPPPKIYTISELNATVRTLLEDAIPSLWISGEVSNLHIHGSSGHAYFSLKDERAQVRCAMFRANSSKMNFILQNGVQVVVRAEVSLYEARGEYQLIVQHIERAGVGVLQQKFLALKNKLQQEGLFDVRHKKPLPKLPCCVGVVTSPQGAAVHDILSVLQRRYPFISVIIYPTQVQGADAAAQITRAIEVANQRCECDVLIIGRGGGSLEDLWSFNEEVVARAIFASTLPTISAVGHEVDFTIADFVADVRAPTPSAAAEIVVPDCSEKIKTVHDYYQRLGCAVWRKLQYAGALLQGLQGRLQHPRQRLQQQAQRLDELERRLLFAWRQRQRLWQHKLERCRSVLRTLSPLATLERGYAIAMRRSDGAVIKSVDDVMCGDVVDVLVAKGKLGCSVVEKNDKERKV